MDPLGILKYFTKEGAKAKDLVAFAPNQGHESPTAKQPLTLNELDDIFDLEVDGGALEFSVTFKQVYRNQYKNIQIKRILKKSLEIITKKCRYILFPEWEGRENNLHYHGIIFGRFTKVETADVSNWLNKKIGRTYTRIITFPDSYKVYVRKQRKDIDPEDLCKYIIHNYT